MTQNSPDLRKRLVLGTITNKLKVGLFSAYWELFKYFVREPLPEVALDDGPRQVIR
jgi:hypothetical protein